MNRKAEVPVVLELAAALLVPAAAFGFIRVFDTTSAISSIVGASLLSTAVAVLLRRLRVPLSASAAASGAFLVVLVVNRFASGTARFGLIPTGATQEQLQFLIDDLVLNFRELKTPVPALDPFVAAAMIGAWIMAFLTDWGAMRLRLAFEPVLPAGLLFVFAAVLGAGTHQIVATFLFAAAVAFWSVTQRTVHLAEGNDWLVSDRRRGSIGIAQAAGVLAVIALIAGVIVGPKLPGASAEEYYSFRNSGDPTRVVISPYVNIQARLVDETNVELFTVVADQPEYWRLAGLDTYEDNIWKVAGNFSPESGDLPGQTTLGGERIDVRQDYSVAALGAIWLPGAFAPAELLDASAEVTWNAETSSLTVANDIPDSDGVSYSLVSSVPRFTAEELRASAATVPPDIAEAHLAIPQLPEIVRSESERIVAEAGAATRYDQMLALQNYFRGFDYSVELGARVGDPIEQFLNERVGFCQQFAGTFALMARQLGAPSRVAIGFTWGDPVGQAEDGRTIYEVTGRQAHAWPEVWFDGLGWVPFEPTPGRGSPGMVPYTGQPAAQDSLVQPDNPSGPVTTTTTVVPAPGDAVVPGPQFPDLEGAGDVGGGADEAGGGGRNLVFVLRVLAVLAIVGAYAGGVPLWHLARRERRRRTATTPAAQVETAWAEAADALELGYDLTRRQSETRREYAHRLRSDLRVPGQAMIRLAELTTVARYYPEGLGRQEANQAAELSHEIEAAVASRVPAFTRWTRLVDPRRLLRPSARVVVSSPSAGAGHDPVATPDDQPSTELNGHRARQAERVG
jgi:transglutaminase-like putative cysteine protease